MTEQNRAQVTRAIRAKNACVALKNLMITNKVINNLICLCIIFKKIVVLYVSHVTYWYDNQVLA